jgi:hypothetical protein
VTVRAADLAFCDLGDDHFPSNGDVHQATHIGPLIAQVVEVQNIRVRLSAVNAGVIVQVLADLASEIRCLSNSSNVGRRDLFGAVSVVPLLCVGPLAR